MHLTWVHRVAANHLLTTRKRRMERVPMSFESFAADLRCGLANPAAACRCRRRIHRAIELGRVDPRAPLFAGSSPGGSSSEPVAELERRVGEVDELHRAAAIMRSNPRYAASGRLVEGVRRVLDGSSGPGA